MSERICYASFPAITFGPALVRVPEEFKGLPCLRPLGRLQLAAKKDARKRFQQQASSRI
jgi:hypothetical protein